MRSCESVSTVLGYGLWFSRNDFLKFRILRSGVRNMEVPTIFVNNAICKYNLSSYKSVRRADQASVLSLSLLLVVVEKLIFFKFRMHALDQ